MQCLADLSLLLFCASCTCRSVCLVALMTLQQSMIYAFSTRCQQKSRISARTRKQQLSLSPPLPLFSKTETKAAFKGSGMEICIECVAYFRAERWNCFQLTHTLEHACTALSRIYLEPTTQAAGSSIPPTHCCLLLISPPFLTALRCKNFVCCLILCCEAKVQLNYEFQFYFRANNNNNWATITS